MPVNKPLTMADWTQSGQTDAPDLSTLEFEAKFAATPGVRRGRPKAETTKVHIGFRLRGRTSSRERQGERPRLQFPR